ncbi:hypothetical protein [Acidithiobacillus ferrooxidans]|uniref:hypothetical protein n=1 Tax=Acidithiobacillus ferrooxidans TaxID=920 RepID=UPI000B28754E|nr:hypothetical protein [Acidithiobacillus ferrooxidans]
MRPHNKFKLMVSAAVAAALAISPLADAHTIAVVVACNPGTPGAVSQMPAVSQGSSSTATAICPQGTYPSAAGLDGTQALLAGISAAALAGGSLALSNIGGASSGSSNARGLPETSGSGSGGVPGGSGSGGPSGSDNKGAPITSNGSATPPAGAPAGSDGQTYPVSAHQITGFPSPEISPSQLTSYTPPASGPSAGGGSPNSNGGQSSGGQAGPSGGLGNFFGHLAHAVGAAAQQIGHAVVTGGTTTVATIPGYGESGTTSGQGSTVDNTGSSGFSSLNHFTQVNPAASPVSPMTGATPGTIELHSQPRLFTLTGGPTAYRALVRWVSGFEGSVLSVGGGGLNTVVHPGTVTPERLPGSGATYYPYSRLSGYADFYITELGHRYVAFPGNPVRFVANIPTGGIAAARWVAAQKIAIQATGTHSSGPQFYTSMPGNRNGPFWPSPFTLGGPEPDIAGACHGIQQITHVSMGGYCWSETP